MSIANKLKGMAVGAIVALITVGVVGLWVANGIDEALVYSNTRVIPSIQTIYQLKSNQQVVALSLYRHINSTHKEQMAELEKTIEGAAAGMKAALATYERLARTSKGRELLAAEKAAVADYLKLLPAVLEKSRASDKGGALESTNAMAASRATLVKLIDEHIALNESLAKAQEESAEAEAQRGQLLAIGIVLIAALLVGGISFVVIRGINRSLGSIQNAMARIEGDLDFTVHAEVIGKDEIATVAAALNRLIDTLRASLAKISGNANSISEASAHLAQASSQVAAASAH